MPILLILSLALLSTCGESAAPTVPDPREAMVVSSVTGRSIQDVTPVTFVANAIGFDAPSYAWDFGDGSVGAGIQVSHVYADTGSFTVKVRVTEGGEEAIGALTHRVGSLTGTWVRSPVEGVRHRLHVVQEGAALSGTWIVTFDAGSPYGTQADTVVSPLVGSLTANRKISLRQMGECERTIPDGDIDPEIAVIGGSGEFCSGPGEWLFTRE